MGFLKKIQNCSEYVLILAHGLRDAEIRKLPLSNCMVTDSIRGTAYPVGTEPIRVRISTPIPANTEVRMYLLHAHGAGVYLEPSSEATSDLLPVEIREDRSVLDMKTTPELNNQIIANNILGRAVAIEPDRRTILIALLAGLIVGSVVLAPIMGYIMRLVFG